MKRSFWIRAIFVSLVLLVLSGGVANSETLPKDAKNRFVKEFENSITTAPMFFPLSLQISEEQKEPPHYGERIDPKGFASFIDFLVANGYVKEVERKGMKGKGVGITYDSTQKLLSFVMSIIRAQSMKNKELKRELTKPEDYLIIAKPRLDSIEKVEKKIEGDYDIWRVAYTFYIEPSFSELPKVGPNKTVGEIRYNRLMEEYYIYLLPPSIPITITTKEGKVFKSVESGAFSEYFFSSLKSNRQKWMSTGK